MPGDFFSTGNQHQTTLVSEQPMQRFAEQPCMRDTHTSLHLKVY